MLLPGPQLRASEQPSLEPRILEVHTLQARVVNAPSAPLTVSFELTLDGGEQGRRRSVHRLALEGDFIRRVHQVYGVHGPNVLSAVSAALSRRRPQPHADASGAIAQALDRLRGADTLRYFVTLEGVVLTPAVSARVNTIGRAFFARSGWLFVVTSGVRSPRKQAEALYTKLRLGENIVRLYAHDRAARAVQRAYTTARKVGSSRAAIIDAMTNVIADQVSRGVFLSNHLKAGAVDIRSRGMTRIDRRAFTGACREVGVRKVLLERRPPHWHLELQGVATTPSAQTDGVTHK